MNVPIFGQRDARWKNQRLGTNNDTTIGGYGCAMTSLTMADGAFDPDNVWTPAQMDDYLTANGGYVDGNGNRSPQGGCCLLDWSKIDQLLPNTAHVGTDWTPTSDAPVAKIKDWLDKGGLCEVQVGFGGDPDKMHFVLVVGYNRNDLIFNDPWYGDQSSFASGRYGQDSFKAIIATHYLADRTPNTPPPAPVAPAPTEPAPVPAQEPTPAPVEATPVPNNKSKAPEAPADGTQKPVLDQVNDLNVRVSALEKLVALILGYLSRYKTFIKFRKDK